MKIWCDKVLFRAQKLVSNDFRKPYDAISKHIKFTNGD